MRATDLGFRSPKERTAEYTHPIVTFDGRSLPIVHQKANFTIGKARRFSQYDAISRRTHAGPGSYDLAQHPGREWRIKGSPVYRSLHQGRDTSNNGFYFFGHSMVYEPSFVLPSKAGVKMNVADSSKEQSGLSASVRVSDGTSAEAETKPETKRVSTTSRSRRSFKRTSDRFNQSPYLEDFKKQILQSKSQKP
jgi:hypothetical protein